MGSTVLKMSSNTHLILLFSITISFFMVNAAVLHRDSDVSLNNLNFPEVDRRALGMGGGMMNADRLNRLVMETLASNSNSPYMFTPLRRAQRSFLLPFLTRPLHHKRSVGSLNAPLYNEFSLNLDKFLDGI